MSIKKQLDTMSSSSTTVSEAAREKAAKTLAGILKQINPSVPDLDVSPLLRLFRFHTRVLALHRVTPVEVSHHHHKNLPVSGHRYEASYQPRGEQEASDSEKRLPQEGGAQETELGRTHED